MYKLLTILVLCLVFFLYPHLERRELKQVLRTFTVATGIPRIIFRTHKTFDVSKSMYESCHQEWEILNPRHSIIWYSGQDCENFVRDFGDRVYKAYKTLRPGSFKADLWRACILYKYGGVYVDSYSEPFCSISLMLQNCLNKGENQFIAVLDKYGIHNGFLICTAKHPFLRQYILDMVENVENRFYGKIDLDITGPGCLWRSMNKSLGLQGKIFKEGYNNYGDLSFYLYRFSPGPSMFVYKGNIPILRKKYSLIELFIQRILNFNSGYYSLWNAKKVYIEEAQEEPKK